MFFKVVLIRLEGLSITDFNPVKSQGFTCSIKSDGVFTLFKIELKRIFIEGFGIIKVCFCPFRVFNLDRTHFIHIDVAVELISSVFIKAVSIIVNPCTREIKCTCFLERNKVIDKKDTFNVGVVAVVIGGVSTVFGNYPAAVSRQRQISYLDCIHCSFGSSELKSNLS